MTLPIEPSLLPFFEPRGIVLIGASANPTKLGFGIARNLLQSEFQGAVHLVNPKGGTLLERRLHARVADVPDPVDLAILLLPASHVPDALEACGRRGIRAAIIASGGFRETGEDGILLEEECLRVAQEHDIRLIGPNCIGLIDTHLPMDTTFLPPPGPPAGAVAFVSHSGAMCAAVVDWARDQGFGLSRLISLGNQLDVSEADVLPAVSADPYTRVITMYLEGVSDGRRFVSSAQQVARVKPIIALKVGRYAGGQQAVASHTGALAGSDSAFDAAFRRAGIIRAESSEQMFDWARALAWCPIPEGRKVAILTNAGGPGVTAADAVEANGLCLANLEQETVERLREILPTAASVMNPVDMLASASPELYANSLQILISDLGVDSVLTVLPPPPMFSAGAVAKAIIPVIHGAQKPVVVALMGGRLIPEAAEHFRAAQVAEYRFPERAASALAVLSQRADLLLQEQATPVQQPEARTVKTGLVVEEVSEEGILPPTAAFALMSSCDIPVPQHRVAQTAVEAAKCARALGFPVALKLVSSGVIHKSDVNGVLLGLADESAVRAGFRAITTSAVQARPGVKVEGVAVQPMIPGGQEVIVGFTRDPQFGPVMMFGSGGTEVEGLEDVAFALAPMTQSDVDYVLENTWAGRRLEGFRNLPPADKPAVVDVLMRLGQLASDFPSLQELEINPLIVLPAGEGVWAVDVRVRVAKD